MSEPQALAGALVSWFHGIRRDLPWRRTKNPYHIWVSEIMLQQTQVATVIPYYERFLAQFPTPEALATAPQDRVLKAWEGLGYYSRARNLQAGAGRVATEHGGIVPDTWDAVRALPGVGDYTAGAILSIAYGVSVPAVDGNVMRVLARVYLIEDDITKPATKRAIEVRARALLPPSGAEAAVRPGDVNEALMELGATVCVPVRPRCEACPIAGFCRAKAEHAQDRLPVKAKKAKARAVTLAVAIVERDGKLLVAPRGDDGIWAGLWAFPTAEALDNEPSADAIARVLTSLGIAGEVWPVMQTVSHTLTHRQLTMPVHRVSWRSGEVPFGAGTWIAPDDLGHYPLPVPMQKIARSLDYGPLFRLRSEPS